MESHIRVMATVDEMKEAFDSDSDLYSVRHYSILIDDSQYTDEEWEKVKHQKYPFKMIIRHEEYPTRLNEKKMYSSWNAVVNSLKRKKQNWKKKMFKGGKVLCVQLKIVQNMYLKELFYLK